MNKRIAIYITSPAADISASQFPDYGQMLENLLAPNLDGFAFEHFMVAEGVFPVDPAAIDAVIITGSSANVTESEPWVETLYAHIRLLDSSRTKLFAVCFGHQAVAVALGGKVASLSVVLGAPEMEITAPRGWMQPTAKSLRLYAGNFQQVVQLPDGMTVLASHPDCPIAMAEKGNHILTVQFHPEFDHAYMHSYIDMVSGKISPQQAQAGRQSVDGGADGAMFGHWAAAFLNG